VATPSSSVTGAGQPGGPCVPVPSRCGYPDATSSGVTDRSHLRRVPQDVRSGNGWAWDSRGWLAVTKDGAVVENLLVTGSIDITGDNATVRGNVIAVSGETWGVGLRHTTNTTISGNTIGPAGTGPRLLVGIKDIYGDAAGTNVLANDISGTSTAVQIPSGVIRDNYIHDLAKADGDHVNGITSNGSDQRLDIVHNTVLNQFDQTDAIGLFQDFGVEANRRIAGNLLAGGGYTIYAGDNERFGVTHDVQVVGNRFSRVYFPKGGMFGPSTSFDSQGAGNLWAGNVWDEDGSPVA
jgi:hypothetical protein